MERSDDLADLQTFELAIVPEEKRCWLLMLTKANMRKQACLYPVADLC